MSITLQTLSQNRKFNKEEALTFIDNAFIITPETASYLVGYDYSQRLLTDEEVYNILQDRERKYKKELKFSKKKKLPEPKIYDKHVEKNISIITPAEHQRDHKDLFFPELEGLTHLLKLDFIGINKINELIKMYGNKNTDFIEFFYLWSLVIKENKYLSNLFSIEKWFVIILEDKLTLGASWNKKCPVDLSIYKETFGV